jgi:hypothetical protein
MYKSDLSCQAYKSEQFVLQRVYKSETIRPARQLSYGVYKSEKLVLQGV